MRIILIGFGVVGQSFALLLAERRQELASRLRLHPRLVAAVDRGGYVVNPEGLDPQRLLRDKREKGTVRNGAQRLETEDLIRELEAEVVVEATPTKVNRGEPALTYIRTSLQAGKGVVTTNKGPLALALPALTELAQHNGVQLRYSGAVGGGTPILDFGRRCALAERVLAVEGILNGTTNFILTQMERWGMSFTQALEVAQRLGYAEADASLDIDGVDTACKLVILANHVLNRRVTLSDVKVQGIRRIDHQTVQEAAKRRKAVRLIGTTSEKLEVQPTEIDQDDPICVKDAFNAVRFRCEHSGEKVVAGKGAGGLETASAILRDLIEIRDSLAVRWTS